MSRQGLTLYQAPSDWRPTDEQREAVARAVACGLDAFDIAFMLHVDPLSVKLHFADELRHGTAYYVAKIGSAMIDSGLRGDVNAQRAFLQMRGRWAAPTKQEADNDALTDNHEQRRRLMASILNMVQTGKVEQAEPVAGKR